MHGRSLRPSIRLLCGHLPCRTLVGNEKSPTSRAIAPLSPSVRLGFGCVGLRVSVHNQYYCSIDGSCAVRRLVPHYIDVVTGSRLRPETIKNEEWYSQLRTETRTVSRLFQDHVDWVTSFSRTRCGHFDASAGMSTFPILVPPRTTASTWVRLTSSLSPSRLCKVSTSRVVPERFASPFAMRSTACHAPESDRFSCRREALRDLARRCRGIQCFNYKSVSYSMPVLSSRFRASVARTNIAGIERPPQGRHRF